MTTLLSPEEIKEIRERLGISQSEAGEKIGGGPKAFAKYETGKLKPSAAVIKFLLALKQHPYILTEKVEEPPLSESIITVQPKHITSLNETQFVELNEKLLYAEAFCYSLNDADIHTCRVTKAKDGGKDSSIKWKGAIKKTKFIPCQDSTFQIKATAFTPAKVAKELTDKSGLNPSIRSLIERGGSYIIFCSNDHVEDVCDKTKSEITNVLKSHGCNANAHQIHFYNASRIANWVNEYPAIADWVLETNSANVIGRFKRFENWLKSPSHQNTFCSDDRLEPLKSWLMNRLGESGGSFQIIGPYGIGKSRLLYEALLELNTENRISDLIFYHNQEGQTNDSVINDAERIANSGKRAILVILNCPKEAFSKLKQAISVKGSNATLFVTDCPSEEVESNPEHEVYALKNASDETIGEIVASFAGKVDSLPHNLISYSSGFPQVAIDVSKCWKTNLEIKPLGTNLTFTKALIKSEALEKEVLAATYALAAIGKFEKSTDTLELIAQELSDLTGLNYSHFAKSVDHLNKVGILKIRGRFKQLAPKPVALGLAAEFWKRLSPNEAADFLLKSKKGVIKSSTIDVLSLLNTDPHVIEIVTKLIEKLDSAEKLLLLEENNSAQLLNLIALIEPNLYSNKVSRILEELDANQLKNISGDLRYNLVRSLEVSAFESGSFENSAKALAKLAVNENESWSNNSTGAFNDLFLPSLGSEADYEKRMATLSDLIESQDIEVEALCIEALKTAGRVRFQSRGSGPEKRGAKAPLHSYIPKTYQEIFDYLIFSQEMLLKIALGNSTNREAAKTAFIENVSGLISYGQTKEISNWVDEIIAAGHNWPELSKALAKSIKYDVKQDSNTKSELITIRDKLKPTNNIDSAVKIICHMDWDYPEDEKNSFEEKAKIQEETIISLVNSIGNNLNDIMKVVTELLQKKCINGVRFGGELTKIVDNPEDLLCKILDEMGRLNEEDKLIDKSIFVGVASKISEDNKEVGLKIKKEFLENKIVANEVPRICLLSDIDNEDIQLIIEAIDKEKIEFWSLNYWTLGGVLAKCNPDEVRPLLLKLMSKSQEYKSICADLLGMYVHGDMNRLDDFIDVIELLTDSYFENPEDKTSSMYKYNVSRILNWTLAQDPNRPEIRKIAIKIANGPIIDKHRYYRTPQLEGTYALLAKNFPSIAWKAWSDGILAGPVTEYRVGCIIAKSYDFGEDDSPNQAPILLLPETEIVDWLIQNPEIGPRFILRHVKTMIKVNEDGNDTWKLNPFILNIFDILEPTEEFFQSLMSNLGSYSWSGNVADYYRRVKSVIEPLTHHNKLKVKNWAKNYCGRLEIQIEKEDEDYESCYSD